jgi:hypothetical protein
VSPRAKKVLKTTGTVVFILVLMYFISLVKFAP